MPAIHLETDMSIVLRDGTITRANVWRDADGRQTPAILVRSPYTKEVEEITAFCDPRRAVPAGFAVVSQDVRGRGHSAGAFTPFAQEFADGYDTVQAVAAMEWCSGDVVMCGDSYVGAVQWLAAATHPPALRAIAPAFTASRYDEGRTHRSGVLELGFVTSWIAGALAEPSDLWLDDVERAYTDREGVIALAPWAKPLEARLPAAKAGASGTIAFDGKQSCAASGRRARLAMKPVAPAFAAHPNAPRFQHREIGAAGRRHLCFHDPLSAWRGFRIATGEGAFDPVWS